MANSFPKVASFLFGFVVAKAFVFVVVGGDSVLCVRCESRSDARPGDCERRPPAPTACYSGGNQRQFCVRIWEYAADGKQLALVRDCTTLAVGKNCTLSTPREIELGSAYKTCVDVCSFDGCNASGRLLPVVPFGLSSVFILFLLLLALGEDL